MAANPWNPSQPLPDADEEKEAIERARRAARVEHLKTELLEGAKPKPEKKPKTTKAWE